jgi:hypothetical protein
MLNKIKRALMWAVVAVAFAAVLDQLKRPAAERTWHGNVFGIPYDFRPPRAGRLRQAWWNPDEPRLSVPRAFGVGWDVNVHHLMQIALRPAERRQNRERGPQDECCG